MLLGILAIGAAVVVLLILYAVLGGGFPPSSGTISNKGLRPPR
jgi:hypothetical protein